MDLLGHNEKSLMFGDLPAVCFHVHTLKKLDYTNYGQFLVDRVKTLMRQCNNTGYEELIQMMEEKDDGT